MQAQTITAGFLKTICWVDNTIVDWASSGERYTSNGKLGRLGKYHYAFGFDSAISSPNGIYVFIYKRLGTKGLLLKNGELLREINRSYACAESYEFPATFVALGHNTYLVHCPISYNQLDFEDVETGKLITNVPNREPDDIFHSRLEVSHNGKYLLSKGWLWHPLNVVIAYNIEECLNNPLLLDNQQITPETGVEISTASFINDENILIGSSDEVLNKDGLNVIGPRQIAVWNLKTNLISNPSTVKTEFGNLYAINEKLAWDLLNFPKIINILTGEIIDENNAIDSGQQQSSIINSGDNYPAIIYNRTTGQIAIKGKEKIEILTP